jgi:hypothetical protein
MPTLREYQHAIAAALVSGDTDSAAALIDDHRPPRDRLNVHRNTMLGALTNALVLTFPAVQVLVGTAFFSQTARVFIQAEPPRAPLLSSYGGFFSDFLANYEPVRDLPYLVDVARLEWAVEYAAQEVNDRQRPLDIDLDGTRLALAPSLKLVEVHYPAELIWRAALNHDGEALGQIDMTPIDGLLAVWHDKAEVAVSSLSAVAGAFLKRLLVDDDVEAALNAAAVIEPDGDPIPRSLGKF